MDEDTNNVEKPSLLMAILPIVLTMGLLMVQLFVFDDFTPHVALALGILIAGSFAWRRGYKWPSLAEGMYHVASVGLPSLAILMTVGMIIGVWILSGTVLVLIYYGLGILTPGIFLVAGCLVCALISLATGTSWGTVGTVGLALVGIGEGLGIPMHLTGGAVVFGAFFGDKMSPLSDTTNLAPAVCGTNLRDNIRGMIPTTGPAMLVALAIYAVLGMKYSAGAMQSDSVEIISAQLQEQFYLSWWLLSPPAVVVVLAVKRFPALPSIFSGVILGGIVAIIAQGTFLYDVFNAMQNGFTSDTGIESVDKLLSKGGIQSMIWIITLVLIARGFGGTLEKTRCLEVVLENILKVAKTRFGLISASILSSVRTNVVTGDVYLSITLPGRMFAPACRGKNWHSLICRDPLRTVAH